MMRLIHAIWHAVLTASTVALAVVSALAATVFLNDGLISEFRLVTPVIAVFVVLSAADCFKDLVFSWWSKTKEPH